MLRRFGRTAGFVVLGCLVAALLASIALAANINGDGTLIGTSHSDSIQAGAGNDTVFGLGGNDSIQAGNGNDHIDLDGSCPAGVNSGVYPNGLPAGEYCEDGPIAGSGAQVVQAGSGNDVVWGGGGFNTIQLGNGADTVYGGPVGNSIMVGNGADTVWAGGGPDTIQIGTGYSNVYAQNGVKDTIQCTPSNTPNHTTVYADHIDVIKGKCFQVLFTPQPSKDAARTRAGRRATHQQKHRSHTSVR
jgi:Ca2+-binding RTX toxin-like protein